MGWSSSSSFSLSFSSLLTIMMFSLVTSFHGGWRTMTSRRMGPVVAPDLFATTMSSSSSSVTAEHSEESSSSPQAQPPSHNHSIGGGKKQQTRFRQHVNPLSRRYQAPAELSDSWPRDTYADCADAGNQNRKPLHIDIGCGKGGFLLNVAMSGVKDEEEEFNYLGLEIRPGVATYAKERIAKRPGLEGKKNLDFIGCNANVDLERILHRYHHPPPLEQQKQDKDSNIETALSKDGNGNDDDPTSLLLRRVSIQFPDPHFKKQHAKRRVVTEELVQTLAAYMPKSSGDDAATVTATVFLQSDVKDVLDDMRERFRVFGADYFCDALGGDDEYISENTMGIPTEREISVLKQGLPVYRALFTRNDRTFLPLAPDAATTKEESDDEAKS